MACMVVGIIIFCSSIIGVNTEEHFKSSVLLSLSGADCQGF
jgi:hypothetical protein